MRQNQAARGDGKQKKDRRRDTDNIQIYMTSQENASNAHRPRRQYSMKQ